MNYHYSALVLLSLEYYFFWLVLQCFIIYSKKYKQVVVSEL